MAQVLILSCTLKGQEGSVSSTERGGDRGSLSLPDLFKVSEAVCSGGRNQIRAAIVRQGSRIARTPKKSLVWIRCVPASFEFPSIGTLTETGGKKSDPCGKARPLYFGFIDKITSSFKLIL